MNKEFRILLDKFNNNPYSLSNDEVKILQQNLGFTGKSLDGLMGKNTIKAVQRLIGTKDDGIWGNNSKKDFIENIAKKIPTIRDFFPSQLQSQIGFLNQTGAKNATDSKPTNSENVEEKQPTIIDNAWKDVTAALKSSFSTSKTLNRDKVSALLNFENNNKLRQAMGLPLVNENDKDNPYKLIDKNFIEKLSSVTGREHAMNSYTMTNDLLDRVFDHEWTVNGEKFKLKENGLFDDTHSATNHFIWSQGYSTPRNFGIPFNQEEEEREFVRYNPQYKKLYDDYKAELKDEGLQRARKKAGVDHVLTKNAHDWYNVLLQNASTGFNNQNRDRYTDHAAAGNSPFMGDHAYDTIDAVDQDKVVTGKGIGTVYPDGNGVYTNPDTANYRRTLGLTAIGAKPGKHVSVSRVQPKGVKPESTFSQKLYQLRNDITPLAFTDDRVWKEGQPNSYSDGAIRMAQRAKDEGEEIRARGNAVLLPGKIMNLPLTSIAYDQFNNMMDKVISTGGGEIPQYMQQWKDAGYNGQKINPGTSRLPYYDLNGLGNASAFFDTKTGEKKSLIDQQDWKLGPLTAGLKGSAQIYAPNPKYAQKEIDKADEVYNNYYAEKAKKEEEDKKYITGTVAKSNPYLDNVTLPWIKK